MKIRIEFNENSEHGHIMKENEKVSQPLLN